MRLSLLRICLNIFSVSRTFLVCVDCCIGAHCVCHCTYSFITQFPVFRREKKSPMWPPNGDSISNNGRRSEPRKGKHFVFLNEYFDASAVFLIKSIEFVRFIFIFQLSTTTTTGFILLVVASPHRSHSVRVAVWSVYAVWGLPTFPGLIVNFHLESLLNETIQRRPNNAIRSAPLGCKAVALVDTMHHPNKWYASIK